MSRAAWTEFICSPERAGRHLSAIGRGVSSGISEPIDLAVLRAFLERLHDSVEDIHLLGNVVDLVGGGYLSFARRPLPRILDALSNEMRAQEQIVGPGLRGNPLWDRTLLRRISGTLSPVHYVSRTAHRSFELPENQLLSWLVHSVRSAINAIEARIGTSALHDDLQAIRRACDTALTHPWFGDVSRPSRLSPAMIAAASRQRRPEYRQAAALARRRLELETNDHRAWWYTVLSLLAVNWLEPINDDDLFELYVLVLTLDILVNEMGFGEPVEYGLVTSKRGHIAQFEDAARTITVFFDQSPAVVFSTVSAYAQVFRYHNGISGSERRPDILIVADDGQRQRLVLVEVKKSADGRYISDSVYKVFGYLYDFAGTLHADAAVKAILVVPGGVTATADAPSDRTLFVASGNDRSTLSNALMAALSPSMPATA